MLKPCYILLLAVLLLSYGNLSGQNFHEVMQGMVRNYRVQQHSNTKQYIWEVFSDYETIKSVGSDEVVIKSSPSGLQNEIVVEWKVGGTYFLTVTMVGNSGCINRKVWPFMVKSGSIPKAVDDEIETGIDIAVWIDVHENDSIRMIPSTIRIISQPINGTALINNSNFGVDYVPDPDFMGDDYFQYTVCDSSGICDTAIVIVHVLEIILPPQVFTPNNDGYNDYFVINGIENYPNNHISIYNRWGNLVYEKQNYENNWDGYANVKNHVGDRMLSVGVYYYVLRYTDKRYIHEGVFLER